MTHKRPGRRAKAERKTRLAERASGQTTAGKLLEDIIIDDLGGEKDGKGNRREKKDTAKSDTKPDGG